MPEYVVERYWPGVTDLEVRDVVDRLNRAIAFQATENRTAQDRTAQDRTAECRATEYRATEYRATENQVSYLGSTLVLSDELVCCRFDAESAQDIADLNDAAGLRYDRILRVHSFPQG